jgi:hypothetical protein
VSAIETFAAELLFLEKSLFGSHPQPITDTETEGETKAETDTRTQTLRLAQAPPELTVSGDRAHSVYREHSGKTDLLQSKKRPTISSEVSGDRIHPLYTEHSLPTVTTVTKTHSFAKASLPTLDEKETYNRAKRDLLDSQKRPTISVEVSTSLAKGRENKGTRGGGGGGLSSTASYIHRERKMGQLPVTHTRAHTHGAQLLGVGLRTSVRAAQASGPQRPCMSTYRAKRDLVHR